ncbi:hypothetical protein MASR1M90_09660 [Desulfovibrionales bacterium]
MSHSELFLHWTFDSFAPGSVPRAKYNAFQSIHTMTKQCSCLMAQIQDVEFGQRQVDWSRIVALTAELSSCIRTLIDQLQIMNPVDFMDVHDWANKIGFYARLATALNTVPATPPYIRHIDLAHDQNLLPFAPSTPCATLPAIVLEPSLFQYFLELNDLRPALDAVLHTLDLGEVGRAKETSAALQTIIQQGVLPAALYTELDIVAVDLAPRGGSVDVWVVLGQGRDAFMAGTWSGLKASDFASTWIRAVARKYAFKALAARISRGLADEEDSLTIVLAPAGAACWTGRKTCPGKQTAALLRRLDAVSPFVTRVQAGAYEGIVRADQCKSLHDLLCLCTERSLAQIFSFAGKPGRGLGAIKDLRLEIPVHIAVFNLGDGLFPSAAEKTTITVEDVRCVPAWSLLLGLVCPVGNWESVSSSDAVNQAQYTTYAVIAQNYLYAALRFGLQRHVLECRCSETSTGFVRYQYIGSAGNPWERSQQQRVVRLILEDQGFTVQSCGDFLEAVRTDQEVLVQRNLACLGLLLAWLHSCTPEFFGSITPAQGLTLFQDHITRFLRQPS